MTAAVDPFWVGDEELQQTEFCWADLDRFILDRQSVGLEIHPQASGFQDLKHLFILAAAKDRAHPGQQFAGREWLGDVIVGPAV